MTDVNVFSTPISNLNEMTTRGSKSCGQPGDLINWKEANWTLHSKARIIEVDSAKGPCRRKSMMHVYLMSEWHHQSYCMQHCEKLGGRSPPLRTSEEWTALAEEIQHLQVELSLSKYPWNLWLSATEGDKESHLSRLDHWPKGIEAEETVWRDNKRNHSTQMTSSATLHPPAHAQTTKRRRCVYSNANL